MGQTVWKGCLKVKMAASLFFDVYLGLLVSLAHFRKAERVVRIELSIQLYAKNPQRGPRTTLPPPSPSFYWLQGEREKSNQDHGC